VSAIRDLVDQAVLRWGDRPAVTDPEGTWTYRRLAAETARVADSMPFVEPGDRVLVVGGRSRPAIARLLAPSLRAATAVPVSGTQPPAAVSAIRADCQPRAVLDRDGVVALPAGQRVPLDLVIYTSGSTGRPRGVMCEAASVGFAVRAIQARLAYTPQDRVFLTLPLSFDYGLYQVLLCLLSGAELVLGAQPGPGLLADLVRSRATVLPLVPSLARGLLALGRRSSAPAALRLITNTGEHLHRDVIEGLRQRFGAAVRSMYGLTECKRVSISEPDEDLEAPDTVGRPLPGTRVQVIDPDGRVLPAEEVGELVVTGPHVMAGYWGGAGAETCRFEHRPDGTRRLFTGDLGSLDAQGRLRVVGRRDSIFKLNGVRVSTVEIELAAMTVPGIVACVMTPATADRPATLWFVGPTTGDAVRDGLTRVLDAQKIPSRIRSLDRFPLADNGKIDRRALAGYTDGDR
jgi:acyl-CoA synthetase (AMP-forming)/AMP-acid ligase II